MPQARGQSLNESNLISACSGVRLPRSAVTSVMAPVINGVVTPIQNTINPLLGVVDLLTLNALPGTLNLNVTSLLSNAAAGEPLSLQLVAKDGTLLGPSAACNVQLDTLSLDGARGISIGGNTISGLGANGAVAISGELNSIAFGNGASTASTALGAMALGTGANVGLNAVGGVALGRSASVLAANGVALGASSLVTRAPSANYVAPFLSGQHASVGAVSVGASGAERQIVNVAPGTMATDAVNLAQLAGVAAGVTALDSAAIKYDDVLHGTLTLAPSGTRIAHVAAGSLGTTSSDAVNGSQLYHTNQEVAANASHLTTLRTDVANGSLGPVRYANPLTPNVPNGGTATNTLTLVGGAPGAVSLHNVAAGAVSVSSTDAVNGSQLFQTNSNLAANAGLIGGLRADLNTQALAIGAVGDTITAHGASLALAESRIAASAASIVTANNAIATNTQVIQTTQGLLSGLQSQVANGAIGILRYVDPLTSTAPNGGTPTNGVALVGAAAGPVALHNLGAGALTATSTDAVNGGQLFVTNGAVAANGASIGVLQSLVAAQGLTLTSVDTRLGGHDSAITDMTSSLAAANGAILSNSNAISSLRLDAANGALGPVQYSNLLSPSIPNGGTGTNSLTLVGAVAGTVGLHNLAAGSIQLGSTDAVNGAQLFDTNTAVNTINARLTGYDQALSSHAGTLSTLSAALADLDASASAVLGPVRYSDPLTSTLPNTGTPTDHLTLVGSGTNPVGLHNIAAGAVQLGSTEAVNGEQLFQTNNAIAATGTLVSGLRTDLDAQSTGLSSATTLLSAHGATLALHDAALTGIDTRLTGQDGLLASQASTLTNLQTMIADLNAATGTLGALRYSDPLSPQVANNGTVTESVTLVGTGGNAVTLHNLAGGLVQAGSTDAINGDQLFQTNSALAATGLTTATLRADLDAHGSTLGSLGTQVAGHDATLLTQDIEIDAIGTQLQSHGSTLASQASSIAGLSTSLLATNAAVQTNADELAALSSALSNGAAGLLRYSDAVTPALPNGGVPSQTMTLVGSTPGAVALHNVADATIGFGSTQAVNGGQLFLTNSAVAANSALIGVLRTDLDAQGLGLSAMSAQLGDHDNLILSQVGTLTAISGTLSALDVVTRANADELQLIRSEMASGILGPLRYSDPLNPGIPSAVGATDSVTLVGASGGPVSLHNLAPGLVAAGSTGAINGAQLFGFGNIIATTLGLGSYDPQAEGFTSAFRFGNTSYASVQDLMGAIENSILSVGGTVGGNSAVNIKYFKTNSIMADSSASGADAVASGPNAVASGEAAVASGRNSRAESFGAVAIGTDTVARGGKAVSIGTANVASGDGAVAIGDPNYATGAGAVALGRDNIATGEGAVALGDTNATDGDGSVALGYRNIGTGVGATLLGSLNTTTGNGSVAIGISNNVIGAMSIALGSNNLVQGDGSLAIGNGIRSTAADTLAIGSEALAGGHTAAAIGNRAAARAEQSIAVGNDAVAVTVRSSAFGTAALASGLNATAVGANSVAAGTYATAVGRTADASGFGTTALGLMSKASAYGAMALGAGSMAEHAGSVALGTSSRTVRGEVSGYEAFGVAGLQTSMGEVAIARNVPYFDPNTNSYTPRGNRQITGLAAGSADTDAVNVAQLKGAVAKVGAAMVGSLGGGATYDIAAGSMVGPRYALNGTNYDNVSDALGALASQIGTAQSGSGSAPSSGAGQPDAALVAQIQALSSQLSALQSQLATLQASASRGGTLNVGTGNHAALVGDGQGAVRLSNVADGRMASGSTDAVNGSQLAAVQQQVDAAVKYDSNGDGTRADRVTFAGGASGDGTRLANVAAGTVSASSREAVNGSQLHATNQAVTAAQGTADQALALGQSSVRYDSEAQDSVTLGKGQAAVALRNVAAGTQATDAANVGQLSAGLERVLGEAATYTDTRVAEVQFDIRKVSRTASAGTAGALAVAGMPQPTEPGRKMFALGGGTYNGERAISFGFSGTTGDGRAVIKAGMTYDSQGKVAGSAGMGVQF